MILNIPQEDKVSNTRSKVFGVFNAVFLECYWCICCIPYYLFCCCCCYKEVSKNPNKPEFVRRFTKWASVKAGRSKEQTDKDPIPCLISLYAYEEDSV